MRLLLGELPGRGVALLLQLVELGLALACQPGLLVPRLGELLNLGLPVGREFFLGRFRLLSLLQLRLLLGELTGCGVALLPQLVELGCGLACQPGARCSSRVWVSC
ncbi:MAG: hypothetical protein IPL11_14670 [Candidatus Accumulibacter sp.]|nr:hypothetical protein [Accumulibacter sp.]